MYYKPQLFFFFKISLNLIILITGLLTTNNFVLLAVTSKDVILTL